MEDFKEYWNKIYMNRKDDKIVYDNWLDKYLSIILKCKTKILDLGCGSGNDTLYLVEKGFNVISCDYSEEALENLKKNIQQAETIKLDISQKLPFSDNEFDIIIADLSLHYFDEKTTKQIMLEIKRILKSSGHLFARVNSINDKNHGAGQGCKLEKNYYFVEGYNKRFFDEDDAKKYFSIIGEATIHQSQMIRYSKTKELIEIKVEKK